MSKRRYGNNIRIPDDPPSSPGFVGIIILFAIPELFTKLIGGYLLYKRIHNETTRRRYQTYRRYASAIADRATVSIRGLAAEMGRSTGDVLSDLQTMIDEGMIGGNAYIDRSHMTLYMDASERDTVETEFVNPVVNVFVNADSRAQTVAEAKASQASKASQARKDAEEKAAEPKHARPEPVKNDLDSENLEEKLREIRQLNDEIEDRAVSDRIDRIGELTASIFRVVREKPEHAEEVRKFMNYYLPTTLKLLKSYSLMEKQSYQGENIQASRKKIESVLDTLTHAFEQQQDRLFKTEALDVETDISVLETMMASDGLLGNQSELRAGGGH